MSNQLSGWGPPNIGIWILIMPTSNYVNLMDKNIVRSQFFSWYSLIHVKSVVRIYFWGRPISSLTSRTSNWWDMDTVNPYIKLCLMDKNIVRSQFFGWYSLIHVKSGARIHFLGRFPRPRWPPNDGIWIILTPASNYVNLIDKIIMRSHFSSWYLLRHIKLAVMIHFWVHQTKSRT